MEGEDLHLAVVGVAASTCNLMAFRSFFFALFSQTSCSLSFNSGKVV